jgi:hypothetical protein
VDAREREKLVVIGLVAGELTIGEYPPGQRPPHRGQHGRDPWPSHHRERVGRGRVGEKRALILFFF